MTTLEKLKDKLHDKIEIHVCEVEENTLIAQGMLKALGMMDEVLEKAEQEPCDDVVSRQVVIECLERGDTLSSIDHRLVDKIKRLPSVRPQEQTGHWIINKDKSLARCSNCKFNLKDKDEIKLLGTFMQGYNYCPYCNTKMVEPRERRCEE